jgi:hypothetical protein
MCDCAWCANTLSILVSSSSSSSATGVQETNGTVMCGALNVTRPLKTTRNLIRK